MIARKAGLNDAPELNRLLFKLMVRFEKMDAFDKQDRNYWEKKNTSSIKKVIKDLDKDFIVAKDKGRIIGFIEVIINKREPIFSIKKNGHIETLFVDPSYRKKGYGKILVSEAMKWFRKKKIKHITVGTHAKDAGANSFWKKMGFREYNIKYRK